MSPEQRSRALRLAKILPVAINTGMPEYGGQDIDELALESADLLRELAGEPVRVPMTDEKFEEFIEQFRWYDGDVDRYDIQGFARELLRAHGIV